MGFQEAIKSVFTQYAGFTGRARRSEYWYFFLFSAIVSLVLSAIDGAAGIGFGNGSGPLQGAWGLAVLIPTLAVGARRLHDTGRSGWWQLIALVPILGWIGLIVLFVQDSVGDNDHGPTPKRESGEVADRVPQPGELYGSVPPPPPAPQGEAPHHPGQGGPPGSLPAS